MSMENKMKKLPFLSHSMSLDPPKLISPWGFPSCGHLETLSFRSTATVDGEPGDPVELGLRSDRLFFEPERSSLLVEECVKKEDEEIIMRTEEYKESEMVLMDSSNPKEDFKKSMEEMVNAYGLMKDWDGLEELLGCFLRINCKNNHMYILSAFVDLLVSLPFTPSSTSTSTTTTTTSNSIAFSSPSSPFSLPSSSLSSILDHHGDDDHDHDHAHNDNDDDHHIS